MRSAYRVFLSGKVQGVGFRSWTKNLGEGYGLSGWVRNLPDGRVEVFVELDKEPGRGLRTKRLGAQPTGRKG